MIPEYVFITYVKISGVSVMLRPDVDMDDSDIDNPEPIRPRLLYVLCHSS